MPDPEALLSSAALTFGSGDYLFVFAQFRTENRAHSSWNCSTVCRVKSDSREMP
jgi:hypothetical protein